MRIAFITRTTLYTAPGGDTIQVTATAKYLKKLGVDVDIKLSTDAIDHNAYDLLHFFNIIRPADILKHIGKGIPYVVSTIFVDYSAYEKNHRKGVPGFAFKVLPAGFIEYAKTIARYLVGNDKIASPQYILLGQTRSIKKIIRHAACLLPNSENEYHRLKKAFGLEQQYRIVPNGIDPETFPPAGTPAFKDADMVVCAARIEGIKNQLNLIKALSNTRFRLYIIGRPAPNQQEYYHHCKQVAGNNVIFIDHLPQQGLLSYYRKAKVHVLPSWFETTGLSSLEAAAMGCNVVASDKGDVKDYLGSFAFYCNPASPESIRQAVEKASASEVDPALEQEIRTKFTWEQAALSNIRAYSSIICE